MKKFLTLTFVMLIISTLTLYAQEKVLPDAQIPNEIKNYVMVHFPDKTIVKAKSEIKKDVVKYEVKLNDNTEIDFNAQMQPTDIESPSKLPDTVIPEKIRQYVASQYPGNFIIGWENKKNKQEAELDNKVELVFDLEGNFLKVDK